MDLCDVNIWLALTLSKHVHHVPARAWLDSVSEPERIYFCRSTQQALLRLLTNAAVLEPYGNRPLTNTEAWSVYEAFLGDDRVVMRSQEPPALETHWQELAVRSSASPKLWMDAYLAGFALAAGDRIVTTDSSFRQFSDLDVCVIS